MLFDAVFLLLICKESVQFFLAVFTDIVAFVIDNFIHAAAEDAGRLILFQNDFIVVVNIDFQRILLIDV